MFVCMYASLFIVFLFGYVCNIVFKVHPINTEDLQLQLRGILCSHGIVRKKQHKLKTSRRERGRANPREAVGMTCEIVLPRRRNTKKWKPCSASLANTAVNTFHFKLRKIDCSVFVFPKSNTSSSKNKTHRVVQDGRR